jgi:integrase
LRSEEILKLKWSSVDFPAGEIHVPPEAIKKSAGGMREKYVAMLPAFLRAVPRDLRGKVIPVSRTTFHYHATRLAQKLGYQKWPHNCLRHSFASYHLAMWENASTTAHQLGHTSTKMVFENYARAVKKADAIRWWNL